MQDIDGLLCSIYDCAANPDLWPNTLTEIRDRLGAAFTSIGFADLSPLALNQPAYWVRRNSPWDENWLNQLNVLLGDIPHGDKLWSRGVDAGWTQMSWMSEVEFQQSKFCREWVQPQNLRDCLSVPFLQRQSMTGIFTAPSAMSRDLFSPEDMTLMERLSPHLRRAMMINDLADKGRLAATLYRQVLDTMSAAVFVIGAGRKLVFSNASGETMLAQAKVLALNNGSLTAWRIAGAASALDEAIDRAAAGDVAMGVAGIGVPLIGQDGERAAAYVLPIAGSDVRGDMGRGHCAVFVAHRGEQQPMLLEVLRTLFDLTQSEARIAMLIAQGDGPAAISESLGLSVNTVRSHLARCYTKTQCNDQTSLGSLVNKLLPPVMAAGPPTHSYE